MALTFLREFAEDCIKYLEDGADVNRVPQKQYDENIVATSYYAFMKEVLVLLDSIDKVKAIAEQQYFQFFITIETDYYVPAALGGRMKNKPHSFIWEPFNDVTAVVIIAWLVLRRVRDNDDEQLVRQTFSYYHSFKKNWLAMNSENKIKLDRIEGELLFSHRSRSNWKMWISIYPLESPFEPEKMKQVVKFASQPKYEMLEKLTTFMILYDFFRMLSFGPKQFYCESTSNAVIFPIGDVFSKLAVENSKLRLQKLAKWFRDLWFELINVDDGGTFKLLQLGFGDDETTSALTYLTRNPFVHVLLERQACSIIADTTQKFDQQFFIQDASNSVFKNFIRVPAIPTTLYVNNVDTLLVLCAEKEARCYVLCNDAMWNILETKNKNRCKLVRLLENTAVPSKETKDRANDLVEELEKLPTSLPSKASSGDVNEHKVHYVMNEFKHGELKSSNGKIVKNRRQAIAIALSEGRRYKH